MLEIAKWVFLFFGVSIVALQSLGQQQNYAPQETLEDVRQGRNLLDWIGFGTGPETDPYLAQTNAACLNGDLAECFKSRALSSFEEFFNKMASRLEVIQPATNKEKIKKITKRNKIRYINAKHGNEGCTKVTGLSSRDLPGHFFEHTGDQTTVKKPAYHLSENARIFRLPEAQLRQVLQGPYEYSESPRADEPEWDKLVKFAMRKVEKFLKTTSIELAFNDEVTERGRYSPRFIDEIVGEIDIIEDKKDSLFKRKQLKKLFIPLLLILKIFKLKLLLFLPLILGLASFKKLLGFLALIIPGAIAFFNFCKPILKQNGGNFYGGPQYSPAGIAYQPHYREPQSHYAHEYSEYPQHVPGTHFRDENSAQSLAYGGWNQYRSNEKGIEAEVSTKKSILPDS